MSRKKNLLLILMLILALLEGCNSGTSIPTPNVAQPQFAYVANFTSGDVSGYSIDGATGALTPIPGSPFPAGSGAVYVAIATASTSNKFLYVANFNSNTICAYSVNSATGALTPVPGSPFVAGGSPQGMAVNAGGQFLFVANSGSNDVSAFVINPDTGALTPTANSPFGGGNVPVAVTVDPTNKYVFVANLFSDNISMYIINSSTGSLAEVGGSPFGAGTGPSGVVVDSIARLTAARLHLEDVAGDLRS